MSYKGEGHRYPDKDLTSGEKETRGKSHAPHAPHRTVVEGQNKNTKASFCLFTIAFLHQHPAVKVRENPIRSKDTKFSIDSKLETLLLFFLFLNSLSKMRWSLQVGFCCCWWPISIPVELLLRWLTVVIATATEGYPGQMLPPIFLTVFTEDVLQLYSFVLP